MPKIKEGKVMRFSKYVGDINIDIEGKPEEVIQVLEYINGIATSPTIGDSCSIPSDEYKQIECKKIESEQRLNYIRDLLKQIEKNNYTDEIGHPLKNNEAYYDLVNTINKL